MCGQTYGYRCHIERSIFTLYRTLLTDYRKTTTAVLLTVRAFDLFLISLSFKVEFNFIVYCSTLRMEHVNTNTQTWKTSGYKRIFITSNYGKLI